MGESERGGERERESEMWRGVAGRADVQTEHVQSPGARPAVGVFIAAADAGRGRRAGAQSGGAERGRRAGAQSGGRRAGAQSGGAGHGWRNAAAEGRQAGIR